MMTRRRKLVFKEAYKEGIILGTKVTTVRLKSDVKVGEIVDVFAGRCYLGSALVTSVEAKRVSQLSDEDAKLDGFRSREELVRELKNIYGKLITDATEVKVIKFKLIGR